MKTVVIAALAACALAASAAAQPTPETPPEPARSPQFEAARQAMREACAADFRSLCPGLRGGFAFMCLTGADVEKLTPDCRASLMKLREAGKASPPAH